MAVANAPVPVMANTNINPLMPSGNKKAAHTYFGGKPHLRLPN